jgi:hypothetical protein
MGVTHGYGSRLDPPLERRREKREHEAGHDESVNPSSLKRRQNLNYL